MIKYFQNIQSNDAGFSLLEVLITLSILGLSLTVLLPQFPRALAQINVKMEQAGALNIARSQLADFVLLQAPESLPATGQSGHFEWIVSAQELDDPRPDFGSLWRYEIQVKDQDDEDDRRVVSLSQIIWLDT